MAGMSMVGMVIGLSSEFMAEVLEEPGASIIGKELFESCACCTG